MNLGLPGLHALADVELAELRQDSFEQRYLGGRRPGDHRLRHAVGDRLAFRFDLLLPGPRFGQLLLEGLDLVVERHLADREGACVDINQ